MINAPSGGAPEKAPRWDLTGTDGCGGGKGVRGSPRWFQGIRVYIGERSTSVELRGAHVGGGAPTPWARPPDTCLDIGSKSPELYSMRKSRSRRFHSVWTPFDIPFLQNPKTGKNSSSGLGLRLIG